MLNQDTNPFAYSTTHTHTHTHTHKALLRDEWSCTLKNMGRPEHKARWSPTCTSGDLPIKNLVAKQKPTNKIEGCVHAQNTVCTCAPIYHPHVQILYSTTTMKLHSHGYTHTHNHCILMDLKHIHNWHGSLENSVFCYWGTFPDSSDTTYN